MPGHHLYVEKKEYKRENFASNPHSSTQAWKGYSLQLDVSPSKDPHQGPPASALGTTLQSLDHGKDLPSPSSGLLFYFNPFLPALIG